MHEEDLENQRLLKLLHPRVGNHIKSIRNGSLKYILAQIG